MTHALIDYFRQTNLLTDAEVASYVAAQQRQIDEHFGPAWDVTVDCQFQVGGAARAGAMQVILQDHSPQEGALGFHTDDGLPRSFVFVADDQANGNSWTVTASHETLEMLADPTINRTVIARDLEYAHEVCDAPEDDAFAYECQGLDEDMILLSAFVLPSWFNPVGAAPFCFPPIPDIAAPFQLAPGGYIGVRSIGGQWEQRFARGIRGKRTAKKSVSRTVRRFRPHG